MVFVQRDNLGAVIGLYANAQPGYAEEQIADDDPAVAAFSAARQYTPPSVPQVVSDRQFFQQLAVQGTITQDEALSAIGPGTLPASLAEIVSKLPAGDGTAADSNNQQFKAKALLIGATSFERSHPMVAVLGQAFGWDSAQLDALWAAAALL